MRSLSLVCLLSTACFPSFPELECVDDGECAPDESCVRLRCTKKDTGVNGTDAGLDAGEDAGDAGDAGSDAAADAGRDAGDAGDDAGTDGGLDGGPDAGMDAGMPGSSPAPNGYRALFEVDVFPVPDCDVEIDPTWTATAVEAELAGVDADRVFCFAPGDYGPLSTIEVRGVGSPELPRWMRLSSTGTVPPARLPTPAHAVFRKIVFESSSSDWVVHRLSLTEPNFADTRVTLESGAQEILFDRCLFEDALFQNVRALDGARGLTVQNSVMRNGSPDPMRIKAALNLQGADATLVNNEIYDFAGRAIDQQNGTGRLILENNDIYLSASLRYECATSALDPFGDCSAALAGIRIRGGPIVGDASLIFENRIWGFRPTPAANVCCGGQAGGGDALLLFPEDLNAVRNVLIRDNLIFDTEIGVRSAPNGLGFDHLTLADNYVASRAETLELDVCNSCDVYQNIIVDGAPSMLTEAGAADVDVRCNVIVSSELSMLGSNLEAADNAWYDATPFSTGADFCEGGAGCSRRDTGHVERCFMRKIWTEREQVCLPVGTITSTARHAVCSAGGRPGIGADDDLYERP